MKKGINNKGFKALPSSVQNNILSNMKYGGKKYAAGGAMPMEQLTEFNEGGRHEENGLGGIPQGMNPDGQMNLVEEGETKFDSENYIYSDSLKVDKELAEAFNLSPKMVGKTFADASKMAGRKKSKREGDAIEMAANEKDLMNLMEAQEAFKQARVEEKLQEIAELDPNALPALMGQGQPQGGPQGDPAMGGQMQEAPMDEQAMMEQQMMAEQQGGGGQPSPEEMAMMEQQQNQMMGQQEGMMRNGGYATRSYNLGGFMGANPGMMNMANAGAMGMSADPKGCPCTRAFGSSAGATVYSTECCGEGFDEQATKGLNYIKKKKDGTYKSKGIPKRHIKSLEKYDVNYDEHGEYNRNRADNGINTARASQGNFANFDLDLLNEEQKNIVSSPEFRADPTAFRGKLPRGYVRDARKVKQALDWKPKGIGKRKWDFNPYDRPDETPNKIPFFNRDDIRDFKGEFPKQDDHNHDIFSDIFKDGKRSGDGEIQTKWSGMPFKHIRERETEDADGNTLRRPSNLFLGVKGNNTRRFYLNPFNSDAQFRRQQRRANRNEFGGSLMQPMNQMRRGGKMCYGCGGAMHAYGGRMNGMNQMATGGEIVAGIGSGLYGVGEGLLDTLTFGLTDELTDKGYEALQEIGPMKGEDNIGDAIRGGANVAGAATGAVLTGGAATGSAVAQGSKGTGDMLGAIGEETGNETLGKIGQGVEGAGQIAGMIVGGGGAGSAAGSAVGAGAGTLGAGAKVASAADAATKASKAAKFAKVGKIASNKAVQAGTDMATAAIGSAEEKAEAKRLAEEERMRVEREMMMTNDPTSPYYNPTTELPPLTLGQGGYMGTRSYGKGGGLWANIHAKRKRIAAGSNERMRKPGSKGAPTAEALKNSQNAMGGRLYYPGGYLFGPAGEVPEQTNTDNEFNNMYPDISEALEQTPLQQAALYAPIAKNLYDATLAKSDDYNPDFVPAEFVQLDSAQAIQQAKQSNAGIVNAAKAKGFNNPSVMLALNQQLQGTVANVQAQYDQVNAKLKQAKLDKDNTQKTELSRIKQELAMRLKEAKNAAANEALKQAKQIAENKTANELAALYATMGAPDMGQYFLGNKKMTKAEINKAIIKLEKEKKKLENN